MRNLNIIYSTFGNILVENQLIISQWENNNKYLFHTEYQIYLYDSYQLILTEYFSSEYFSLESHEKSL